MFFVGIFDIFPKINEMFNIEILILMIEDEKG